MRQLNQTSIIVPRRSPRSMRRVCVGEVTHPPNASATTGGSDLASRIENWPGALTALELAALLSLGKTAVYEMAATGRIPSIKIGATVRFDPARTAAWLRDREVATDRRAG
jgi:excisionase family DNA binding protein